MRIRLETAIRKRIQLVCLCLRKEAEVKETRKLFHITGDPLGWGWVRTDKFVKRVTRIGMDPDEAAYVGLINVLKYVGRGSCASDQDRLLAGPRPVSWQATVQTAARSMILSYTYEFGAGAGGLVALEEQVTGVSGSQY